MSKEWGTSISKEKIIERRNRLIEYQKIGELRFTPLYEAIDENILDINYMIYEIERLNKIIATAIRIYEDCEETQDYSTCDLDMYICLRNVYKLQELKGDSSNERRNRNRS